mmetsp:Transcript_16939/g.25557  ORF Transcript_16939/g.25557 Transcript_16939/m.25557 type:complete len:531 (+) Transcript_16939:174-1766(+)|eukprot:CAMPEP_0185033510 /NCGR_PEP_ID=MMETSP1103-20130426/22510_1 /TAXON_ID=36769 /ORGANISM="Paraphysomonas bandaiensis, Strain Caron Lab Isolate" /LENGTH=530 /DNA_ID=CAMNT_0027569799 /DNA_START=69 /DNA_END=1661 /DNA_ORIENTATION=-
MHDTSILKGAVLDPEEHFELPIRYYDLRNRVRDGTLESGVLRKVWWPVLVKVTPKQSLESLPDIPLCAKKMYTWGLRLETSKDSIGPIYLSWNEGPAESIAYNVIRLLVQHYDMEDPGLVQPLVSYLARTITNSAICFAMCCDLMDRRDWFINPTAISHRSKLYAFKEILKRSMPQTYTTLARLGALAETFLNHIFVDFFTTLFPDQYVNRIIDVYLLDGEKVLFRYGLALFALHKKQIKSGLYKSGLNFWDEIQKYRTGDMTLNFDAFHNLAFDLNQPFYKSTIVPSRVTIDSLKTIAREVLPADTLSAPLHLPYAISLASTESPKNLLHTKSKILDLYDARRLHAFLPECSRLEGFELVFATHKDGWNIHTLYTLVQDLAPCILILKSVEEQAVIGVYLSCPMSPPSTNVRGDGECFCFRLDGPNSACYRWALGPDSCPLLEKGVYKGSATYYQFAVCSDQFMSFGGSSIHGTNAIRISSDLITCSSGHSDTYNNPPLTPDEPDDPFQIAELEVFCGSTAIRNAKGGL